MNRVDLVITIGGLGPTEDDLTREALAEALEEPLIYDEQLADHLRFWFARRNLPPLESHFRQAYRLPSARALPNPNGTAPGLLIEKPPKIVFALPGPPNEFKPMVQEQVVPYLAQRGGGGVICSRVLRTCGIGEAYLEEKIRDLIHSDNPTVATLAHLGEVHLRITARAENRQQAEQLLAQKEVAIRERIEEWLYGVDEQTLEEVVVHLLREKGQTLATAESCTGGLLGDRITNVSGSSEIFLGGIVSYSNALKTTLLKVSEETLNRFGAVSEQTARAMAEGVRQLSGAHWGVGITGIAGPTGATATKPVGLVYIALSDPTGTLVEQHQFLGDRKTIKWRASQAALVLLRKGVFKGPCASLLPS